MNLMLLQHRGRLAGGMAQLVYVVQRIITMRLAVEGRLPRPSGSLGGAPH